MKIYKYILILIIGQFINCYSAEKTITNGIISLNVNSKAGADVYLKDGNRSIKAAVSEQVFSVKVSGITAKFKPEIKGNNNQIEISAIDNDNRLKAVIVFTINSKYQDAILASYQIENISEKDVELSEVSAANFILDARSFGADSAYKFWSFQGSSYISRPDWVFPLTKDYSRENFMGNNNPDYGGGMPIVDLWTKAGGIAFASTSEYPEQISLPVIVAGNNGVEFRIFDKRKNVLKPGEKYSFIPFAIMLHHGDFYNGLHLYSKIMQDKNLKFPPLVPSALESEWCAWGYLRNFDPSDVTSTLAKAKEVGFDWATLDDGWQSADGDWDLMKSKFPNGDSDFKAIVDSMHAHGLKARLWWAPYSANDSAYNVANYPDRLNEYAMKLQSKVALEHPDWFMLDENGKRYQIEWWNSYLLCPELPEVQEHFKKFVKKALTVWGFDGFKIDGQNINAVPPCYNPKHHHKHPDDASKAVPDFFKMIYNTTYSIKKDAVVQICPCGTNFSLYNIPYATQFVASDPSSSWQVRHRGKVFKALVGNAIPYTGDHVELTRHLLGSDLPFKEDDFASTIAVGGVVASKFTLPDRKQQDSTVMLTPEKEIRFKHWEKIYNTEKLSEGTYVNLYDIAYDLPETHLIKKNNANYYSFFSDIPFNGKVELRGLDKGKYEITDYVNNVNLGIIDSSSPYINIKFTESMLIKAVKQN